MDIPPGEFLTSLEEIEAYICFYHKVRLSTVRTYYHKPHYPTPPTTKSAVRTWIRIFTNPAKYGLPTRKANPIPSKRLNAYADLRVNHSLTYGQIGLIMDVHREDAYKGWKTWLSKEGIPFDNWRNYIETIKRRIAEIKGLKELF